MKQKLYNQLTEKKGIGRRAFTVLIDPDKVDPAKIDRLVSLSVDAGVDSCNIPVILFPGSPSQISKYADALLYLSLISGRNPELLIGQHVVSAPFVKQSGLEIMPTGYMVIDGGAPTTVSYISNASPIPSDKNEIAMCTAMAGEMLGMKLIYMDSGSGAKRAVTETMIEKVASHIEAPLIIGGGIAEPEKAYRNCKAGADIIVVGNAIEKDASLIKEMSDAIHSVPVTV